MSSTIKGSFKRALRRGFLMALCGCAFVQATASYAAIITKANNADNYALGSSWVGGVTPGSGDIVLFDSTYTARTQPTSPIMNSNQSYSGIVVGNVAGATNADGADMFTAKMVVIKRNGNAGPVLSIGADGIDMSAATSALKIETQTSFTSDQTWTVNNTDAGTAFNSMGGQQYGEDLLFKPGVSTSSSTTNSGATQGQPWGVIPMNLNGNVITTEGTGTILICDGMQIRNGVIEINNANFVVGTQFQGHNSGTNPYVRNDVAINVNAGANFWLQNNRSTTVNSDATVSLYGGTMHLSTISGIGFDAVQRGEIYVENASKIHAGKNMRGDTGSATPNNRILGNIHVNADLEINDDGDAWGSVPNRNQLYISGGTIDGSHNITKTGNGIVLMGDSGRSTTMALAASSTVTVAAGVLRNEFGNDNMHYDNNFADLVVESGAVYDIWDVNSRWDSLTGTGKVNKGWDDWADLHLGVANGSGVFNGTFGEDVMNYGGGGGSKYMHVFKEGTGYQVFNGNANYSGGTTVNDGTLEIINATTDHGDYEANNNGHLILNLNGGDYVATDGVWRGNGTITKTGDGQLLLGDAGFYEFMEMSAGGLIDVQQGVLRNDYNNTTWGINQSSLNVASGAYFDIWDGSARFDALNGSGVINKAGDGNETMTFGVAGGSGNFSGVIGNDTSYYFGGFGTPILNLVKEGTGTQILGGAMTYSGTTTVSAGKLVVNGSHTGGGQYTVNTDATLGGHGSIEASIAVAAGGHLSPGNSIGTLTVVGNQTITLSGVFDVELSGLLCDLLDAPNSLLDLTGGTLNFDELSALTAPVYVFAKYGTLVSTFASVLDLPTGYYVNYNYGGLNQIALVQIPVPEPSTLAMAAFASVGLLFIAKKRRV